MGRILQRTAISTNIKERLDFSCALFGPDGGLVSNAPHIPVHLGAMQETVQFQIQHLGADLHPGDVLLSNHPRAGGSHLPDLTVITPVFWPGQMQPVFYVASRGAPRGYRGHHAGAPCPPTPPRCSRRVPSSCPSSLSRGASSRRRVSGGAVSGGCRVSRQALWPLPSEARLCRCWDAIHGPGVLQAPG
ncbi:5-oxoprolinase-like [Choloepus didactylus]|uniref:5-oxoprolinase-like n=1 Tax=Choloepus didactylus TaxID=27675 RepID=UPI00189E8B16|nr:5-oxoprolinase-like [Choloepus didactylus]